MVTVRFSTGAQVIVDRLLCEGVTFAFGGGRVLARHTPPGRDIQLLRARLGEFAGRHRLGHDGLVGAAGHHRQRAERAV